MSKFRNLLKFAVFSLCLLLIFAAKDTYAAVVINSPTTNQVVTSWAPSVDWGEYSTVCEYSYDNSNWTMLSCTSNGGDIPDPGSTGDFTLYVRGLDGASVQSTAEVFFSFDTGTTVPGCMDSDALNYDSNANTDNGSCYYISINSPANGQTITSWTPSVDWGVGATTCEYQFNSSGYVTADCPSNGSDIPDPGYGTSTLYVRSDGGGHGTVSASSTFSFPVIDTSGCTDNNAINYDEFATSDNGSCYYIQITAPTASQTVSAWSPAVNWGVFTPETCEYSYNNSNWISASCESAGADIPVPGATGTTTLYVRSMGAINPSTSVSFTYTPPVQVNIASPTAGQNVIVWSPSVSWGTFNTTCAYSFDNSTWQNASCASTGNDFNSPPGTGSTTLYIKGYDGVSYSYDDVNFEVPVITAGCTNSLALNYMPAANQDDGSCYYLDITNPTADQTISSWSPAVNWGTFSPTLCQYAFNSGAYVTANCASAGSDIAAPGPGSNSLTIRASNVSLGRGPYTDTVSFTYNKSVSITSPTPGQTIQTWSVDVDWGSFSAGCEYSFDGVSYQTLANCGSPDISAPSVGGGTLYIRGSDGSGYSDASVSFTYTPKTDTPSAPDLSEADDSGTSETDNITSHYSDLTVTGTGLNGTVVRVCKGGCSNEVLGTTTISNLDGTWALDLPTLPNGSHSITVTYQEDGRSVSDESSPLVLTVDTSAPAVPGTPDVQSVYDTGYSQTDNITSSDTATFDITCETGSTVTLLVNGNPNQTGQCSSGTVSIPLSGTLSEATYTISASQVDIAGNTSDSSTSITLVRDATAPVISSVASTTSDVSTSITWTTNENATSTVEYGSTVGYGSASSSSALVTSHALNLTGLSPSSTYHFRVSSTDAAGNRSVSTNRTFTTTATPDAAGPTVQSAVVNGRTLALTFTEALSSTSTPLTTTFTVNGSTATVSSINISGTTVVLTLSAPVSSSDVITLSYAVPLTGTLQDSSGNIVSGFSDVEVTNETSDEATGTQEQPREGAVAVATSGGFNSFNFAPRTVLVIGTKESGQFGPAIYVTGVINETTGAPMNNGFGGLTNTFTFNKGATFGTRNDEVMNLQRFLNAQGFRVNTADGGAGSPGHETNFFGTLTRKALTEFQKIVGITPVGHFGPKTRAFINNFLEKNAPAK